MQIFPEIVYRPEEQSKHLLMELDIVHIANAISSGLVDSLDPFFNDLLTKFFQRPRHVGINQSFDVASKTKVQRRYIA